MDSVYLLIEYTLPISFVQMYNMIKEIARIFDRYHAIESSATKNLCEHIYLYEAEVLYENFEDRNIYDLQSLRQYVKIILKESIVSEVACEVSEDMLNDLHGLLLQ